MDAIFDSSGNVAGSGGGNRLTAWTGQGLVNLLAPSTSGIASAGSLLPADSEMGRAMRQTARYSYPTTPKTSYSGYSQPQVATNLFDSATQSALQKYIDAVNSGNLNAISNRSVVNDALSQYQTLQAAQRAQQAEKNLNELRNPTSITNAINAYSSLASGNGPAETRNMIRQTQNAGIDRNSLLAMDALNRSMSKKYGLR